ncbi:hypothetical protein [Desulfococcus sp.]|uniref:hypothetical protein n=1 Tax=Desulfococcus sp. TaxID=2025834 RepID=UPI003593B6BB
MSDYQAEQLTGLKTVINHLAALSEAERQCLRAGLSDYLDFRQRTERFLAEHFGRICSRKCYESRLSACCSKDGIITFFADVVINALLSKDPEIAALIRVLEAPHVGFKCVYLGERGCLWRLKPIVCEMFLCDHAKIEIFSGTPACEKRWRGLIEEKKAFTWPDRPVLFDALERRFIDAGCDSTLMYLHKSPGLLMVKKKALQKGTYTDER